MQKEIQLTDKTLLVVGLPETTKHVGMMGNNLRVEFVRKDGYTWDYNWGKYVGWQLLGIYPELTEEQAKAVVDYGFCSTNGCELFECYTDEESVCSTALESFKSLMEREQCYTVNPYGKMPEYETQNILEYFEYRKKLYKWQEAQQTTFDKYAILIKSK